MAARCVLDGRAPRRYVCLSMRFLHRSLIAALFCAAVTAHAVIGVDFQMSLGNPSNAGSDAANQRNYLLKRPQYALDYNNTTRSPNWVSWHLSTADLGTSGRGDFSVDPNLPSTYYSVQTTDYSGSGFDRGHVCPSGDRTITVADNQVTFYMSNMVPQTPDHNQGVWASFENYCRSLASAGNELLLISGPGGATGTTLASGVAVPGFVWKIALVVPTGPGSTLSRINAATRVIAIKVPNIAGIRSNPWQQYLTSAGQLETDTGYTFFSELPSAVATALRAKVDPQTTTGVPRITTQPAAQVASLGGSATFTVAATGDAPLTYQWSRDGDEISGATAATLTVSNVQVPLLGSYSVAVGNALGTVTSAAAALSLSAADSGVLSWDFATATPSNGLPAEITNATVSQGANNGTTALLTAVSVSSGYTGASGGSNAGAAARVGPLNRTPGTGSAYFEFTLETVPGRQLVVSSFTFGTRSTGTGPQAFALFSSVDDFTTPIASGPLANNSAWAFIAPAFAAFAAVPGTPITFRLYGYNGAGNAGVSTANWRIDDLKVGVTAVANSATPPVLARQPADTTVVSGGTATLTVTVTGSPAPALQWRRDGVALPGATAATLTLGNVTSAQAGAYSVVATNSAATLTSAPAVLRVIRRSFAGTYFGRLGPTGSFALVVRPDNTGTFLGFAPETRTAWLAREIALADDGSLRLSAAALGQSNASAAFAVTGTVSDAGQLTATAAGTPALALVGAKTTAVPTVAPLAGFYSAGAAARADILYAAVADSGQVLAVTHSGTDVDGATATLDPAGTATASTAAQRTLTLTFSATTSSLTASVRTTGQAATIYAGAASDTAASADQRLVNLSTRATAGTGDQVAIVGFVVTGLESKPVLLRAIGPALRAFGVPTAVSAPRLELMRGSSRLASNAGWSTAANATDIAAAAARSGAFPLASGSADSVILTTLAPGTYTAIASAADGRPGVCLVEVYDLSDHATAQRLANLSMRAESGTGDSTLIAGLVVSGAAPKRVLVRAAGPALGAFGVTGALARPELTLVSGGTVLATNAGWSSSPDAAAIAAAAARHGAFAFGPGSLDAALLIHLSPGAYTAQVSGAGGTSGTVLLEIYEVP